MANTNENCLKILHLYHIRISKKINFEKYEQFLIIKIKNQILFILRVSSRSNLLEINSIRK